MTATPHYVGRQDIGQAFEAKFGGKCASCGDRIYPGDQVTYVDGELCLAHECIPHPSESHGEDLGSLAANRSMPRGATAAQRCSVCFIIPSSNGTCGC